MTDSYEDERCCGTGTCVIDAQGRCWCGQQWDGTQMCRPQAPPSVSTSAPASTEAPEAPGATTLGSANR